MIAVVQRVKDASCTVDDCITGKIDSGLLVYFGVEKGDKREYIRHFLEKITKLRIFTDENYKMNLSVMDTDRAILFISQFTLAADVYKGNRPSFDSAESPEIAESFYEEGAEILKGMGINVQKGIFGAHMEIRYMNDGPITFIVDSKEMKSIR